MSRRRNVNSMSYSRVGTNEVESDYDRVDGYSEKQFAQPTRKFPWKTVLFIVLFCIAGSICLTLGILITIGYYDEKYADRSWPLFTLGILMLIPGGYYGYILMCILLQRDGFTMDDIPEL